MTIITSSGFTEPRLARLRVRIKVIVITIVTRTTSEAPKLRASSLRKVEWNNICGLRRTAPVDKRIMDFELKTLDLAGAAKEKTDVLLVLVTENFQAAKDPLSRLVSSALQAGDLEPKPGKLLQAYRPEGVSASRVILAGTGDGSGRRVQQAVQAAAGTLRSSSAKKLTIVLPEAARDDAVRAAVCRPAETSYVYVATKSK